MNILQICNKSPYPPKEGGPIAMYNLAEGLMQHKCSVDVLAVNTYKFFVDIDDLPVDYRYKTNFTTVYIDTRVKLFRAFFNLFSKKSYHVQRFVSNDFEFVLKKMLRQKNYDIVQLETIYVAPYIELIRRNSNAKIVLRSHNIEHLIWSRHAATIKNVLKKWYVNYLTEKLRKFEIKVFAQVDAIAAITAIDAEFIRNMGCTKPILTVPFGMDVKKCVCMLPGENEKISFFHLGSMNWPPNQEAVRWFLDRCMPVIAKHFPLHTVFLAGRYMPSWVNNYCFNSLKVVGEVNDAAEFMMNRQVMFVPLLSGSGVRIKIIEGMAMGRTIISTSIGAEGIAYTDNVNIMIADTAQEFIDKFRFCIENPEKCFQIGLNARKLAEEEHEIKRASAPLVKLYSDMLKSENVD